MDFWIEPTIEELAEDQGVAIPQPVDQLVGRGSDLWGNDEEFTEFLNEIAQRRRAA